MGALQARGTPRSIHSRPLAFSIAAPAQNLTHYHQNRAPIARQPRIPYGAWKTPRESLRHRFCEGKDAKPSRTRESAMSDRDMPTQSTNTDSADAPGTERQAPRLSPEEIERLEDFEDLESLIEEPPDGSLSIISDQDVPGAPG